METHQPPHLRTYGTPPAAMKGHLPISEELLERLIEEYTADEVADILRALHGVPAVEQPIFETPSESPWPWVAFWLAAGAVLCAWILTHPEWHPQIFTL